MNYRQSRILLSAGFLLALFAALPFWSQFAQSAKSTQPQPQFQRLRQQATLASLGALGEGLLIVRTADGVACRTMTAEEEQLLGAYERNVELHTLSDGLQQRTQQQGLRIVLRGTQQLENFQQAKQAFQRAAAKWQAAIRSNITIVLDVDYGATFFGRPYDPNVIGGTLPQNLQALGADVYPAFRDALIDASSSPQQTAVYNALPPTALPTDLGSTTNVRAASPNLRALELVDPVANPEAELNDFGPPPAIGFNSAFTYDFDPSDGVDFDKIDFEAAATHEIGHALGFLTWMGVKETTPAQDLLPNIWDFFRFRGTGLTVGALGGRPRTLLAGGEQSFFIGLTELALSTATNGGANGDGNQGSHWKDDALTGAYLGIMDPTAGRGEREDIASADLTALQYFGYRINPDTRVFELLAASDNTREESQDRTNALVVNRFTPPRYPAKLEAFRVFIPQPLDGTQVSGLPLRIIAFADANRTGQPPANPSLLLDRTINIPSLPANRVLEVLLPTGPTINSGDLYVGIQSTNASVQIAADLTGRQQNRSFISTNNGQSFQALQAVSSSAPVNFMARALMSMSFASTPTPQAALLSPNAGAPGGQAFSLFVNGSGFQPNSVVRWNSSDRPTTFLSGAQLQAQIPATDLASAGTARVTVFTSASSGGGESAALNFSITQDNPVPAIAALDPPAGAAGGAGATLNVFGVNFTGQSRIRVNGAERATTFVNSTQLSTALTQTDLASSAQLAITVITPAPGGGVSNAVNLTVAACAFTLAVTNNLQTLAANSASGGALTVGFVLNASNGVCPWTAVTTDSWITLVGPTSGAGRSVLTYRAQPNTGAAPREGRISVGNQTLTVRQLGAAAGVSAASFNAPLAPQSIAALFGGGLARETRMAETRPLPTNLAGTQLVVQDVNGIQRLSPLFFVSPGQINFQVAPGTPTGAALLLVVLDNQLYASGRVNITATAPGFFAANANGQGVAAAVLLRVRPDNSQSFEPVAEFNQAQNRFVPRPIDFGAATDRLFLLLFGTGIRGRTSLNTVVLRIGDVSVPAQFAGEQGDLVGLDQVNLELPRSLAGRGEVNITGTVDGRSVNTLTVAFR